MLIYNSTPGHKNLRHKFAYKIVHMYYKIIQNIREHAHNGKFSNPKSDVTKILLECKSPDKTLIIQPVSIHTAIHSNFPRLCYLNTVTPQLAPSFRYLRPCKRFDYLQILNTSIQLQSIKAGVRRSINIKHSMCICLNGTQIQLETIVQLNKKNTFI